MGTTQAHISGQGSSTIEEVAKQRTFHLKQRTNKHGEIVAREGGKTRQATLASAVVGVQNWPTATVRDYAAQGMTNNYGQQALATVVQRQNWPTANARDWKDSITGTHPPSRPNMSEQTLGQAVSVVHGQAAPASSNTLGSRQGLWLTPRANEPDSDPNFAARNADRGAHCHGKLNPRWVETLMGLPIGWTQPSCSRPLTIAPTSCDSSATESCRPRQSERGE
jgi:hypothetical protein